MALHGLFFSAKLNMEEDNKKEQSKVEVPFWQPALLMFSRMSGWIIGPIILAVFLGKWLDKRYDTDPWLFLICVGVAFIISTVGLVKDASKEIERLSKEDEDPADDGASKK